MQPSHFDKLNKNVRNLICEKVSNFRTIEFEANYTTFRNISNRQLRHERGKLIVVISHPFSGMEQVLEIWLDVCFSDHALNVYSLQNDTSHSLHRYGIKTLEQKIKYLGLYAETKGGYLVFLVLFLYSLINLFHIRPEILLLQ